MFDYLFLILIEYLIVQNNSFDQLCINYTNERFQHFFVNLKLLEEKQWYDNQGLKIPFVEFFDNCHIIGNMTHSFIQYIYMCLTVYKLEDEFCV